MTTKTFGRLRYGNVHDGGYATGAWGLDVPPHVAIRVKRMFPRAHQARTSTIVLTDTPEVARDLEWLLDRYPMEADDAARTYLRERADEHRDTEQSIEDILVHGHRLTGWEEPARPSRDYQTQAADLAWTTHGLIVADALGLGKTQSCAMLLRDPATLPALVVCPAHLPRQWQRELQAIFPLKVAHIIKSKAVYPVDADVLITSYAKLDAWSDHLAGRVKSVIYDEVHELRGGEGTARWHAAQRISAKADWNLGATATPVHNYGGDIHTLYEVIAPGRLGNRTEFTREWGGSRMGNDHIRVQDPGALGQYLRDQGMLLARTRKDVNRELPEPLRITHEVPWDDEPYADVESDLRELAALLLADDTDHKERWKAGGEIDWKMRQATGLAKARHVADFVKMVLESEEKVVLYGWHRGVYEVWLSMLSDYRPLMYTGSETAKRKDEVAQAFINDPDHRVLVVSLRSGAGLDGLQTAASVCVFGELDWSPAIHTQAIGRLARDGQEATVAAYFLVTDSGSDPVIREVLGLKTQQAEPILNPDQPLFSPNLGAPDVDRVKSLAAAVLAGRHR